MLDVPVERADVGLVPREMRVAEDDDVGVREPSSQARTSAGGRATLVHDRHRTALDVEHEPVRQRQSPVEVPGDGVDVCMPCRVGQRLEHGPVGHVAGVEDDIGSRKVVGERRGQQPARSRPEMRVGQDEDVCRAAAHPPEDADAPVGRGDPKPGNGWGEATALRRARV
jgi:hypothetical protein